jgi:hypothetical protein
MALHLTLHHLTTGWEHRDDPNVVLLRYEDLLADLDGNMRVIAEQLSITVPDETWPSLVEAATFDHMRARATEVVPESTKNMWHSNDAFFRTGQSGQWRDLLDAEDLALYAAAVARWCDPDVSAWVHRPPLPGGPSTTP